MLEIKVRGTQRVGNKLRKLAAMNKTVIQPTGDRWAKRKARSLSQKKYPPKRPGQRYKRTGRLRASWVADRLKDGVWAIRNKMKYAGFVVGQKQAWMHLGRWWIAKEEIEKTAPTLVAALTKQLRKLL